MARFFHWHGRGDHFHGGPGRHQWHGRWRHGWHPGGGGGDDDDGGGSEQADHGFHLPLPPLIPPLFEVGERQGAAPENEAEMHPHHRRGRFYGQDSREIDEGKDSPLQAGDADAAHRVGRWFRRNGRIVVVLGA